MLVNVREDEIVVEVPAKINLYLEVIGKRKDGFHDIDSIFQAVNLRDRLILRRSMRGVRILASGDPMPLGPENTIYQMAQRLRRHFEIREGVEIEIEKRIPIGAGLGGGSADAAGVLAGLKELWELDLSTKDLLDHAAAIGSDVPFFLYGGTARCEGRGERVTPIRGALDEKRYRYLIFYPGRVIRSKEVFEGLETPLTDQKPLDSMTPEVLTESLASGELFFNRLEEVAFRIYPDLGKIKETFRELPFSGVFLTGSGSSVVGLCQSKEDSRRLHESLTSQLRDYKRGRLFEVLSEPPRGLLA